MSPYVTWDWIVRFIERALAGARRGTQRAGSFSSAAGALLLVLARGPALLLPVRARFFTRAGARSRVN